VDGATGHLLNSQSIVICGGYKGDFPSCQCYLFNNNTVSNNFYYSGSNNKTWKNFANTTECRGYASSAVLTSSGLNDTMMMVGGSSKIGRYGT
jgi:hypothetical protein